MGSIFARPPAQAGFDSLVGSTVALHGGAELTISQAAVDARAPVVLCLGGERHGLRPELLAAAGVAARISVRDHGPDSLNVAMAATIGLYELRSRMAADG